MHRPASAATAPPRPFPPEAYAFVFQALQTVQEELAAAPRPRPGRPGRHITAAELCEGVRELAADRFGGLARTVLRQWGVGGTADLGRIVFELIERGELSKSEGDRPEDFEGLFDFGEAFDRAFDASLSRVRAEPVGDPR